MQRCSSSNNPVDIRVRRTSRSRDRGRHSTGSERTTKLERRRSSSNRSCASGSSASTTVSNIIAQMMIISRSRNKPQAPAVDPPSTAEIEAKRQLRRSISLSREGSRMLVPPAPPPPPKHRNSRPFTRERSTSRPPSHKRDRFQEDKHVLLAPDPPYTVEKPYLGDRVDKSYSESHHLRPAQYHPHSRPSRQHQRNDAYHFPAPARGRSKDPLDYHAINSRSRSKSHHRAKQHSLGIDDLEAEDALVLFDDSDQDAQSVKPPLSSKTYPPTTKKSSLSRGRRSRSKSTERYSSPSMHYRQDGLHRQANNEKDEPHQAEKASSKSKRDGKLRGRGRSVSRHRAKVDSATRRSVSKSRSNRVVSSSRSRRSNTPSSRRAPPPESNYDYADRREKQTSAARTKKTMLTGKGLDRDRNKSPSRREKIESDASIEKMNSRRIREKNHELETKNSRGDRSTNSLETMPLESNRQPITHLPANNMQTARVLNMPYTTPLGEFGWYSGDVNEFGKPHGQGTLRSTTGLTTQTLGWYHGYPRGNLGKMLSQKEMRRDSSVRPEYKHTR